jgi:hypothetical protein
MKMKRILNNNYWCSVLLIFIISISFSISLRQINNTLWKDLFISEKSNCINNKIISNINANQKKDLNIIHRGKSSARSDFSWILKWGYEDSAYFFDYIQPVFRDKIVQSFIDINNTVSKFPKSSKNNENNDKDSKIFELSFDINQITEALKEFYWSIIDASTFIQTYDINNDGRINPRELILGSIISNKYLIGTNKCNHCYENVYELIDFFYEYMDCNKKGYINAEDLWNNLSKLKRNTDNYDIFKDSRGSVYRTSAINDFILKNMKEKKGFLNKNEFRQGILLGFWDRQTNENQILKDSSKTLIDLRWPDGITDIHLKNKNLKK